jgi:peptidoglycan/xylan/chitin deacetylase (PgdA/CDA1 family)
MRRRVLPLLLLALAAVSAPGCGLQPRRGPSPAPRAPAPSYPAPARLSPAPRPTVDRSVSPTRRPRPPLLTPYELSRDFPGVFFVHGPRDSKAVALTFDDGPDDYYTPQILNILQRYGVRATFFLVGRHVGQYPQVVRALAAAGEVVGNHTWDHPQLTRLSPAAVRSEMQRTDAALRSVLGFGTRLMRPPYGDMNAAVAGQLQGMGYDIIYWTDDSLDWRSLSAAQVESNVLSHLRPGDIILQHSLSGGPTENLAGTVQALPVIIRDIRREGLRLVTIPELLGISTWKS